MAEQVMLRFAKDEDGRHVTHQMVAMVESFPTPERLVLGVLADPPEDSPVEISPVVLDYDAVKESGGVVPGFLVTGYRRGKFSQIPAGESLNGMSVMRGVLYVQEETDGD